MRVVVVGATGNVGTALLRRLARESRVTGIVGIARREPDLSADPFDGIRWHSIDVGGRDAVARLTHAFRGADAVINLAWLMQPGNTMAERRRTNIVGLKNVLAAATAAEVPHIVCASSVAAYSAGPKTHRVCEDWPTGGIHTSHYSRHKAIVERFLDAFERAQPQTVVTRVRPGLIFQADAARDIAAHFFGWNLPGLVRRLHPPLLTLPRRMIVQALHADDVADAYWRIIDRKAGGAFNVAAEPVLTPQRMAAGFGARIALPVPYRLARAFVSLTWHLRIQRMDPGWLDLGTHCPVMSTRRAREVLGWHPAVTSTDALRELLDAMAEDRRPPLSAPLQHG